MFFHQRNTEKEKADSVEVFTALICSIERSQAELLEVMEEKQKAAERQAEEFIKELEQEITELKRRDTELEQLSHTEDHLHLLQVRVPLFLNSNAVHHRTALPMLRGFSSLLLDCRFTRPSAAVHTPRTGLRSGLTLI